MKLTPSTQSLRFLRRVLRNQTLVISPIRVPNSFLRTVTCRQFHATSLLERIETHTLSDIGEGVKEVQVIQWFVEEGAQIEEWGPLCEVQSDKASVEITSKYSGVIKKIHFARDAIVQVGDGMVDIEVEGEAEETEGGEEENSESVSEAKSEDADAEVEQAVETQPAKSADEVESESISPPKQKDGDPVPSRSASNGSGSLATPAVRALLKEHNISIEEVEGTGKEGRVMKEDVHSFLESRDSSPSASQSQAQDDPRPMVESKQTEATQKLTPIQSAMFKSMTASLSIPHFLFSDSVNVNKLSAMRASLNARRDVESTPKWSYMPFVIKSVSLALNKYPILNARLDISSDSNRPQLQLRSNHNIGVAMDTPSGLLVPVIKSVNARSIGSIAQELQRLAKLGQAGKLSSSDLSGGTITVSNIGNIGGEVVAPVIVEGQLAIMGMGKIKAVPVFGDNGQIEKAQMMNISWSADHRVIDGATMARIAKLVQDYIEEPGSMVVDMS